MRPTITLTGVLDWTMPGHQSAVKRSALSASLSQPAIWSGQNKSGQLTTASLCRCYQRADLASRRRRRDSD